MAEHTEQFVPVGGAKIHYHKGGSGRPLVLLHGIHGDLGWCQHHKLLAENFTVYAPTLPGFGESERPVWLETVSDLVRFTLWLIDELNLSNVSLAGHSIGGWVAAEMATMSPRSFEALILVDAAGIQPEIGEITDIFLHGHDSTRSLSFFKPEQTPEFDQLFKAKTSRKTRNLQTQNQEATARYFWKPYMFDPSLRWVLERVPNPTLVIWGQEDQIVPVECGILYRNALPRARAVIIPECGHYPHIEKPDEFSRIVQEFLENTEGQN